VGQRHRHRQGVLQCRAVRVDPMKSKLKPPGIQRLKPKCDELLSFFAFNLRRYKKCDDNTLCDEIDQVLPKSKTVGYWIDTVLTVHQGPQLVS